MSQLASAQRKWRSAQISVARFWYVQFCRYEVNGVVEIRNGRIFATGPHVSGPANDIGTFFGLTHKHAQNSMARHK